jgi:Zn-dependent protease
LYLCIHTGSISGRIAGIDVKIHVTFFLLLAWMGYIFYRSGGIPAATDGVIFVVLIFICVLLHELGHALAATTIFRAFFGNENLLPTQHSRGR